MREYVIYRHGWNKINQDPAHGLPEKMAVARVQANNPEEACRLAAEKVRLVDGQHLSAEPAEQVDATLHNVDLSVEALERLQDP
jgi:hypothetical protein